jgi:hypothetical protein
MKFILSETKWSRRAQNRLGEGLCYTPFDTTFGRRTGRTGEGEFGDEETGRYGD